MEFSTALRALELAGLSGVRPSWVLAGLSAAAALGYLQPPAGLAFVATWPCVAVLGVLAIVETLAERDADLASLFTAIQLGLAAASALAGTRALAALDGTIPGWALQAAAVLIALLTVGLRQAVKARLLEATASLHSPARWLARLEEGGWWLAVALLVLAPILLVVLLVVFASAAGLGLVLLRLFDRRHRAPCPHCGFPARVEASRCPECRRELEPRTRLRLPGRWSRWLPGGGTAAELAGEGEPGHVA